MRTVSRPWRTPTPALRDDARAPIAYEVMTYVALDPDYLHGIIEQGYNETTHLLRKKPEISFEKSDTYEKGVEAL